MNNMKKSNKVYIYNVEQARFYISKGINPIDVGIHKKTKKAYYVFGYYETKEVWNEWCTREH